MMRSSYKAEDVIVLLKDITGMIKYLDTAERERLIQGGRHYSEMLPLEYKPTAEYMRVYKDALREHSAVTATAIGSVAEKIMMAKGKDCVIVSLARAGTPIGILIKRYVKNKYNIDLPHYTVSIIRGRGIDHNAMKYISDRHGVENIQFVDGWTGKGAILGELVKAVKDYPGLSAELAVAADPAWVTDMCGTHEDFLIPSSCLNATVSGLISRTCLNRDVIGDDDFHGAVYYGELKDEDVSYEFIDAVERCFKYDVQYSSGSIAGKEQAGIREAESIRNAFGVSDINLVKPGIGEATRVLLRRMPWKVLVADKSDRKNIGHILRLAEEKDVTVEEYPLKIYGACGIIRELNADV